MEVVDHGGGGPWRWWPVEVVDHGGGGPWRWWWTVEVVDMRRWCMDLGTAQMVPGGGGGGGPWRCWWTMEVVDCGGGGRHEEAW